MSMNTSVAPCVIMGALVFKYGGHLFETLSPYGGVRAPYRGCRDTGGRESLGETEGVLIGPRGSPF